MANYPIPENPEYNENIRMLEDTDPASASQTFNPLFEQLIENTAAVKKTVDAGNFIEVEILETICENLILSKDTTTYTLQVPIVLDYSESYYLQLYIDGHKQYDTSSNGGYTLFARALSNKVEWLYSSSRKSYGITLTPDSIINNITNASNYIEISIYKVSINTINPILRGASLLEGYLTSPNGTYSHAEGINTRASGYASHSEGSASKALGSGSHAEGANSESKGAYSHAECDGCLAYGDYSHAEGLRTKTYSNGSHTEGWETVAGIYPNANIHTYAHAEGNASKAIGSYSHAEGDRTKALNRCAHTEGKYTIATDPNYIAVVKSYDAAINVFTVDTEITPMSNFSSTFVPDAKATLICVSDSDTKDYYSETSVTIASIDTVNGTITIESKSITLTNRLVRALVLDPSDTNYTSYTSVGVKHAEGGGTIVTGVYSHAEGFNTNATGTYAHAEGYGTIANNYSSHAGGKYNKKLNSDGSITSTNGDVFVLGNGTSDTARSNCFRITYTGEVYGSSTFKTSGADYAEYFEWLGGNADAEDRVGYFVTLDGEKIKLANQGDYILGIVSGQPCIVGNADEDWLGRWEHDEFGRFVIEEVDTPVTELQTIETPVLDEEGNPTGEVTIEEKEVPTGKIIHGTRYKSNPDYDYTQPYVERKDRKEWDAVGMMGVLAVRDDGTCKVNSFCQVADGGIATAATQYVLGQTYRVIKRVTDNIVKVVFR